MAKLALDLHIHSNNSCDSKATIDQMCQGAVAQGLQIVCFTEHVDMNPGDEGYGYFQYGKYSVEMELARQKYAGRLKILKGIEFSEPHVYPKEFEALTREKFDFVLGSVHWIEEFGAYWADDNRRLPGYPLARFFDTYYHEVLKAVRFGGFDALAHLDFPKRYMPQKFEPPDVLQEITTELVKKNIALELNSQPIRKGYREINPSTFICDLYSKSGGSRVTIGSDAHLPEDIGKSFDHLEAVIDAHDFKPVYFIERKECNSTARNGQTSV